MIRIITTKFLGPTNYKGSRIVASDIEGHRLTIGYPHELSGDKAYLKAANALMDKRGWKGSLIGEESTRTGWIFVFN